MTDKHALQKVILLVDDEINILRALQRTLKDDGYEIFTATSGMEALLLLDKHPIQIVISDQHMPEMSGTEFLMQVNQKYPQIVRLLLTASLDFEMTGDTVNSNSIYKFLSKPWDIDLLREHVRDAFKIYAKRTEK